MSYWNAKYKNDYGEYEITFASKQKEETKAVEKLCQAIIDKMVKSADDVAIVRHGRWILEAHKERVNYRWNVTAECSECCDEKKEIYAGFFPGVPDYLAKDVILDSAKSVKLSNYCPNCGAKMDKET